MKKTVFLLVLSLIFIAPLRASNDPQRKRGKYQKSKEIKKEFTVDATALVKINNKFGNVDVLTWDENRVVIEIQITVDGNNESKVIEKLNKIRVDFENSSHLVSARTIIEKTSSGWFNNNNNNVNFQIDYKVKMPVSNSASLSNDYGSISLNELNGKAVIDCDYGKIIIGNLNHEDNEINIDYTNNSTIDYIKSGTVNADYSELVIDKARKIDLEADYTKMLLRNIEELDFNCDYGKIEVEKANRIEGNGDYLTMDFGTVFKKLIVDADYGGIKVRNLRAGFEKLSISSDYTGIKIGIDKSAAFTFTVELSYSGFSHDFETDDAIQFRKKIVKNSSKYYEGYVNDEDASGEIYIDSDYGSVKWYAN